MESYWVNGDGLLVMGDHVKQAGSFVSPERLRFDFTHFEGTTSEQIKEVEKLANDQIMCRIFIKKKIYKI